MSDSPLNDVPIYTRENLAGLRPEELPPQGALILVDKPKGWTSFDVVAKLRGMLRVKKIGHTGTLDPMATGLLVICLGKATKLADLIQAEEKQYTGTIRFGATTPTDDAESEENEQFPTDHLTEERIREAAAGFLGDSMQTPPSFSAIKIDGKRLYKLARKGEMVEAPARPVTISRFEITRIDLPEVGFDITCSKGTYIRSIARDMGSRLGSGGYLTELRRVRSGAFHVENAPGIPEIQEVISAAREVAP